MSDSQSLEAQRPRRHGTHTTTTGSTSNATVPPRGESSRVSRANRTSPSHHPSLSSMRPPPTPPRSLLASSASRRTPSSSSSLLEASTGGASRTAHPSTTQCHHPNAGNGSLSGPRSYTPSSPPTESEVNPEGLTDAELIALIEAEEQRYRVYKGTAENQAVLVARLRDGMRETVESTEREEERLTNAVSKRFDALKHERASLVAHLHHEEATVATLQTKLRGMQTENAALQATLHTEEEFIVNRLRRQIDAVTRQKAELEEKIFEEIGDVAVQMQQLEDHMQAPSPPTPPISTATTTTTIGGGGLATPKAEQQPPQQPPNHHHHHLPPPTFGAVGSPMMGGTTGGRLSAGSRSSAPSLVSSHQPPPAAVPPDAESVAVAPVQTSFSQALLGASAATPGSSVLTAATFGDDPLGVSGVDLSESGNGPLSPQPASAGGFADGSGSAPTTALDPRQGSSGGGFGRRTPTTGGWLGGAGGGGGSSSAAAVVGLSPLFVPPPPATHPSAGPLASDTSMAKLLTQELDRVRTLEQDLHQRKVEYRRRIENLESRLDQAQLERERQRVAADRLRAELMRTKTLTRELVANHELLVEWQAERALHGADTSAGGGGRHSPQQAAGALVTPPPPVSGKAFTGTAHVDPVASGGFTTPLRGGSGSVGHGRPLHHPQPLQRGSVRPTVARTTTQHTQSATATQRSPSLTSDVEEAAGALSCTSSAAQLDVPTPAAKGDT